MNKAHALETHGTRLYALPSVAEQIEAREQVHAEWTSMVAHDLRQPLSTIALSAEVLALAAIGSGESSAKELERIRWAVKSLTRMTSDLLDASTLAARRMRVECVPVEIAALVRDAVRHMPDLSERCDVHVDPGADVLVHADPGRVEQVLGNLLVNAAKYGEAEGKIAIDLARCDGEVRVTVSNRGPGIPAHELSRVFDRFERGRGKRKADPGLGLGLYIAKQLVEAQGGRIWARSAPGIITQLTFTLPLAAQDDADCDTAPRISSAAPCRYGRKPRGAFRNGDSSRARRGDDEPARFPRRPA